MLLMKNREWLIGKDDKNRIYINFSDGKKWLPGYYCNADFSKPHRYVITISPDLKIPHIGWNALHFSIKRSEIFKYLNEDDCVYFVHSYYGAGCDEYVTATAEYSAELTAAVQNGNVYGCQFHPEKSGDVGLKILRAFCELEK